MTRRLLALLLFAASLAPAYYHFTRFQARSGPFVPVFDRFDLNALPNKTVSFFVSEQGPTQFAPGDSFPALLSQLRAAARVWNSVDSSELRVGFGGIHTPSAVMNTPWIEVVFDLPPGVLGQGGVVTRLDPVAGPNGAYSPITKSILRLPRDLSSRPSYGERLFLTMVHEFGHTLGLQHSWSSGAMSTEITRSTSKAKPLAADDIAGLSILYPTPGFAKQTGGISGRVSVAGEGVNLASVVAFFPGRGAVSTLTNPDGTYTIQGLPAGVYYLYAHALPPSLPGEPQPVNLELPLDPDGRLNPGQAFDLLFYPGTATPETPVSVTIGQTTPDINFSANRRASVNVHSAQTYSFYTQEAIKPSTFVIGASRATTILTGYGLTAPSAGLRISVAGDTESVVPNSIRAYSTGYLAADISLSPFSAPGPGHLLFTAFNESYMLPSAFNLVARMPPSLQTVVQNDDRTLTLTGSNLTAATQVWLDGVATHVLSAKDDQLTVGLPPAPAGYRGVLTAYNTDGQSNLFLQGAATPVYTYNTPDTPQLFITPNVLPAGVETVVEITGTNLDTWAPGLWSGSSDISVRQVIPLSPTRALAHILISAQAQPGPVNLTVTQGLAVTTTPAGFQILPSSRPVYLALSQLPKGALYAGGIVTLPVVNTQPATPVTSFSVTVGEKPAQILSFSNGALTIQIPATLPAGPAIVQAAVDGVNALPAAFVIDAPPPIILGAQTLNGAPITLTSPARAGDTVQLIVSSLADVGATPDPAKIRVTAGGVEQQIQTVLVNPLQARTHIVQITLTAPPAATSSLSMILTVDGRASSAFALPFLLP